MTLNKQQRAAVECDAPEIVLAACPGSGKSTVLAERVKRLISQGVASQSIGCVTFTQSGAKVMQERLPGVRLGHCGTLHSLMLRLLQQHGGKVGLPDSVSVMDDNESKERLFATRERLRVKCSDKELLEQAEHARVCWPMSIDQSKAGIVAHEFIASQKKEGVLDYDCLLLFGYKLICKHQEFAKFEHLMVDECQDGAPIDWFIYATMRPTNGFYVGDLDQSIYSFRGAEPERFLAWSRRPTATLLKLSTNYRSAQRIVSASQLLIGHNRERVPNEAKPRKGAPAGEVLVKSFPDAASELAFLVQELTRDSGVTAAVLFRTNFLASQAREQLSKLGLKLATRRVSARDSQVEKVGKAALAFMADPWSDRAALKLVELCQNKAAVEHVTRGAAQSMCSVASIVNHGMTDFGKAAMFHVEQFKEALQATSLPPQAKSWIADLASAVPEPFTLGDLLLAMVREDDDQPETDGIHVGTVHSAKGREWQHVYLCGAEAELWPGRDDEEESRRLFYVGCTRAQLKLTVTWCAKRACQFKHWEQEPRTVSQFVGELTNQNVS